jgi:hypothetical protein
MFTKRNPIYYIMMETRVLGRSLKNKKKIGKLK